MSLKYFIVLTNFMKNLLTKPVFLTDFMLFYRHLILFRGACRGVIAHEKHVEQIFTTIG
jgi:hypothetical protein